MLGICSLLAPARPVHGPVGANLASTTRWLDRTEVVSNVVLVCDPLYLGLATGTARRRPAQIPSRPSQAVQVYAGALANVLNGAAMMSLQGSFETADQGRSSERLGQEANGTRLHRTGSNTLFGEGCNKDKRRGVP
jgi:hypothetical protein